MRTLRAQRLDPILPFVKKQLKQLLGRKKQTVWGPAIALSTALFVTGLYLSHFFDRLEWITFDKRSVLFRSETLAHPDVAIILIDEASLKAMNPLVGRWPWPRSVYADLLEFLRIGEARAVAFDILFTEAEGAGVRANINDRRLIGATRETGGAYHAFQLLKDETDEAGQVQLDQPLPEDFRRRFAAMGKGFSASGNNNYYLPMPALYRAARGMGVVEFGPDADGVYRRTRLFREYQGELYPVLPMAPLVNLLRPVGISQKGHYLYLDDLHIPLNSDGTYLVNMYGRYNNYSISGVLASIQKLRHGQVEDLIVRPDEFRDKIVFVGASAAGVEDLKTTSLASGMPGVMLHASIASNILSQDFLKMVNPAMTIFLVFGFAAFTGLGILALPRVYLKIALPLTLTLGYAAWSLWRFRYNVVYDMVPPITAIALSWLATFGYLAFTEGRDKKRVRNMLAQYVSPNILAEVVDKYEDYLRAEVGSKEHITVLFSDIRGFTDISELLPPEKVVEILNMYFAAMSDVVFKYEGTLDKFIGDALMAFWGAPIRASDHPRRAVAAALEMHRRLKEVNARLETKGWPHIRMGIGINTGDVILGNIGSEKKLDYTVIGDNVNLASRLESLTKEYDCPLLISESTYAVLGDELPCAIVDQVRVRGKQHPVRIYRPLASPDAPEDVLRDGRALAGASEEAFQLYLDRKWREALKAYEKLPESRTHEIFVARCRRYMEKAPAPEWDGVYAMTAK